MTERDMPEQGPPVMEGAGEATPEQKIRGLLDQIAADVHRFPAIDAESVVRQWLKDAAVQPTDAEVQLLVAGFRERGLRLHSDDA